MEQTSILERFRPFCAFQASSFGGTDRAFAGRLWVKDSLAQSPRIGVTSSIAVPPGRFISYRQEKHGYLGQGFLHGYFSSRFAGLISLADPTQAGKDS